MRLKLVIRGAVQGVGFRPFIYKLASSLEVKGWVLNSTEGVFIEVEGPQQKLEEFLLRIEPEKPPRSFIQSLEPLWLEDAGYQDFQIRPSSQTGRKSTLVLPDIATCPECLADIFDSANRRYLYPFTNCTNCGPRFSIIHLLPYDRPNTSMRGFRMCLDCLHEYEDPSNRRFHAQPNACPQCGPQLELWAASGQTLATRQQAIEQTVAALREGKIVAVKGLGGFHLLTLASQQEAVLRLRTLKKREEKPFALMFPSMASIREECEVDAIEQRLLAAPEAPIVLLRRRGSQQSRVAPAVAPGHPFLGAMVPYTPLHHILLRSIDAPLVATSGNLSDEPICIDEHEARHRLAGIADLFLVHNRPIVRHVDDSVARVMLGREMVLRRARGYAPLPIQIAQRTTPRTVLAVGPHLKSTIALSVENQVFISQHIGDLETPQALDAFTHVAEDLQQLFDSRAQAFVADAHPGYASTAFAEKAAAGAKVPLVKVQHHLAHAFSCMAENQVRAPLLGVSWDGTGYGLDQTVWGGEFFAITDTGWQRFAHLRTFPLPGGEIAVSEPRRAALGLLYAYEGEAAFKRAGLPSLGAFRNSELGVMRRMLSRNLNCPLTSSIGRLFDAIASIAGLRQMTHYEGQAAMELEFAATGVSDSGSYSFLLQPPNTLSGSFILDWRNVLDEVIKDIQSGIPRGQIALRLHRGLAEAVVGVAVRSGFERVVLTGGCFQNRLLTEMTVALLRNKGFAPFWHQRVPPNDGGISLGQVIAALREPM